VLTAEGLVRHEPRRGCFVNEVTEQDLDEIFPVIALLEGRCAYEAAQHATDADPGDAGDLHQKLARHAKAQAHQRVLRHQLRDPRSHHHAGRQPLAGQVIADLRKIVKLARLQQLHAPGRLEQSLSEHLAVFAALKARDAEGAEAAMRTHLSASASPARPGRAQRRGWHETEFMNQRQRIVSPVTGFPAAPPSGAPASRNPRPALPARPSPASATPPRLAPAAHHARAPAGHAAARPGGAVAARAAAHAGGAAGHRRSARERGRRRPPRQAFAQWYRTASAEERRDAWLLMSEQFGPDPKKIKSRARALRAAHRHAGRGRRRDPLRRALVSPRTGCCSASPPSRKACASWSTCAPNCCRT
jgi:DNA-binding GntR family transcriptional regulator